jgi:hypothetical protein
MARNLYLNIGDDVSKAVSRIKRERAAELTLVFPKNSWLISDPVNLKLLKKHTDMLGKYISIMTMDAKGRQFAAEVGFEVKNMDYIKAAGHSMDLASRPAEKPTLTKASAINIIQKQPNQAKVLPLPQALPAQPPTAAIILQAKKIKKQPRKIFNFKANKKIWQSTAGIILLLLILLAVFVFPSANIIVYARSQPISRDLQISVDKSALQANSQQLIIPGVLIDEQEQAILPFNATGQLNIGNKARGPIQIYNFTGKILKLNAKTTLLTAATKTYHFSTDLSGIKPSRYFGGSRDVDPASLTPPVEVVADQSGEDSNLPAGTRFEIHNDVLGTLPQLLYAVNSMPIDGGTSRFRTIISANDLDQASKGLNSTILSSAKQQLLNSKNLTILDSGENLQISNTSFDKKANDQAQSFNGTASGHLTALAFDATILTKLVEQRINLTLDTDKYLVTGSKESIKYEFKNVDLFAGTGVLNVHFESTIASKIDTVGIADKIIGQSSSQIKELLLSDPNIDAVDISLSPFWVRSVPRFSGRVHVSAELR